MKLIAKDQSTVYPPALVAALESRVYKPQSMIIRVSELIGPPLIRYLTMKHWDDLEYDIEREVPAFMGTCMHQVLKKFAPPNTIPERRQWHEVKIEEGNLWVTGEDDLYDVGSKVISDYKQIAAFKFIKRDFQDWENQLNMYAYLHRVNGEEVRGLHIWAFIKDFSDPKSKSAGYPPARCVQIQLPLWNEEKQKEYIEERVKVHLNTTISECTPKERWARKTTYALMRNGRKSAVKVEETMESLENWCRNNNISPRHAPYHIEERPGGDARCDAWCAVKPFCPRFTTTKETTDGTGKKPTKKKAVKKRKDATPAAEASAVEVSGTDGSSSSEGS